MQDLTLATGGLVVAAAGLAGAQAALGHEITLAAADTGGPRVGVAPGVAARTFPARGSWRWTRALGDFLARAVPGSDIVHVHGLWQYPTLAAARACRAAGVPYAISPRGMLDRWSLRQRSWKKRPYLYLVERRNLRGAVGLHATSAAEVAGAEMTRWNPRVFVLPNGLAPSAVAGLPGAGAFRARFPAVEDRRLVLFLGRLHPKKQPDVLLRAFARVAEHTPDLHLVLAGPGDPGLVERLQVLTRDLALDRRVLLTGPLAGAAVQEAYRAASVFVLPSLQENFGNAVAEAMAAECPVVVSEHVALGAEVRAAGAGVVVSPTVEATAAAIEEVLGDEGARREMGARGRRFILEHLTWEGIAGRYCAVYEDMLTRRRTSPAWWPTC